MPDGIGEVAIDTPASNLPRVYVKPFANFTRRQHFYTLLPMGLERLFKILRSLSADNCGRKNSVSRWPQAKVLLEGLQRTVVERQIAEYSKQQSSCPLCDKQRLHKGAHTIVYRTLFGKIELGSPRLFHCQCQPRPTRSFSPLAELLVERTTPELLYLEAKFASLVSYGLSVKLLEEALPIGAEINASTIRNHTLAVAERLESELGDEQAFFIEGCERVRRGRHGPRTATLFESPGRTSARLVSCRHASDGDESNGERPRPRGIRVA